MATELVVSLSGFRGETVAGDSEPNGQISGCDRGQDRPSSDVVRIILTRGHGEDRVQIIEDAALDARFEQDLAERRNHLLFGKDERLQFLTKLRGEELAISSVGDEIASPASAPDTKSSTA